LSEPERSPAFQAVVDSLAAEPGVTRGTGFGSAPGLRFEGRIFTMFVGGEFVLKLPASRVQEMVSDSVGLPFRNGREIPLREWVRVAAAVPECEWPAMAFEALQFSRSVRARTAH
jgi:hypothetical protein